MRILTIVFVVVVFAFNDTAHAQHSDSGAPSATSSVVRAGSHSIAFGIGLLPEARVDPGQASTTGFLGSLSYTYWLEPAWGLEVSASLLDTDLSGGQTTSVSAWLVGATYAPPLLTLGNVARPYAHIALGPYVSSTADAPSASTQVQSVIGTRFGGGLDVYPWRWARLGMRAAYHLAPDYDASGTAAPPNPSGTQVSLEIGIVFGRGQ